MELLAGRPNDLGSPSRQKRRSGAGPLKLALQEIEAEVDEVPEGGIAAGLAGLCVSEAELVGDEAEDVGGDVADAVGDQRGVAGDDADADLEGVTERLGQAELVCRHV